MTEKNIISTGLAERFRKGLPELLVILICMIVLGVGVSQKEGFHMDELLSFELANAEFNPWIVPTQPEGRLAKFVHNEIKGESFGVTLQNLMDTVQDVLENRGNSKLLSYKADVYEEPVWITAEQFHDYITVDGDDDFHYLSVYFNVKDDNHPPLHFMLLHTISSVFRGKAEAWMGCLINMVCVAVCMLLLMRLGKMLAPVFGLEQKGRVLGLLAALLYGLSTGAMATTLLIRMYGLVTCFCVALLYIHVKKWLSGSMSQANGIQRDFCKNNKALIAVTVLGFWTQYFFLFYCLVLAAVTAILLWCNQRRKELWCYVRSMTLAAGIGVCVFPFAVSDVFSSERGVEALDNLSAGFAGYGIRLASFGSILISRTFGELLCGILLLLVIISVCLKMMRRKNAFNTIASADVPYCDNANELWADTVGVPSRKSMLALLVIPVLGYFLMAARMSPYMVDRYIMPLFPFVILLGSLFVVGFSQYLEMQNSGKKVVSVLCGAVVLLQVGSLIQYDDTYLYRDYVQQEAVAQEYADLPCICVYDGVGYYENLPEFTCYEKTLLVTVKELEERREMDSVATLEEVVVLVKPTVDKNTVSRILEEKYGLIEAKELYNSREYDDSVYLFVKVQE